MKKIARILGVCVALTLLGVPLPAMADEAVPRAVFPEESFRFQNVADGQEVEHTFTVRNSGQAPLVIERVKTG